MPTGRLAGDRGGDEKMTQITIKATQKMAEIVNAKVGNGSGGFCVFSRDGSGGYFYTPSQRPQIGRDEVKVLVPWRPTSAASILDDLSRES